MKEKTGKYEFLAEPFHCDFSKRLALGHLGNHLLNAADYHAADRGFGMTHLNPQHKTWVLSRLAVEMTEIPVQYTRFCVETWIESVMRSFTNRNFRVVDASDPQRVYGHGRSVWALIDTDSRQPVNIETFGGKQLMDYVEPDKVCDMDKLSRVKMGKDACLVADIPTCYSDVDVNGHINSVKYIEHVLDLFTLDWYRKYAIRRFDIAYVSESYYGDRLKFYKEEGDDHDCMIRIMRGRGDEETETCRCKIQFKDLKD